MISYASTDGFESDLQTLYRAMFQHRSWSYIQRLAGAEVDRSGASLLKAIACNPSPNVRPLDIAHYLGIEAPSITRKVQQLENEGYLTRSPDPSDGRAFNLSLTAKGRGQLRKLQAARKAYLDEIMQEWLLEERDTFKQLFHKFTEDLIRNIETNEEENNVKTRSTRT
jgi:DNA-binding MarR family transcriptional regulator